MSIKLRKSKIIFLEHDMSSKTLMHTKNIELASKDSSLNINIFKLVLLKCIGMFF